jgi:hypothetical protein
MNSSTVTAAAKYLVLLAGLSMAQLTAQQWHPVDIQLSTKTAYANPFMDVNVQAKFSGPGNTSLTIPGFYAGNNVWKVRFAPTKIGSWTYTTTSGDAAMNGQTGTITCTPNTQNNVHGRLSVDPLNPHHFRYEDGTPYFMMGAEIDWLGVIQCFDTTIAKQKQILDMYSARGFSAINFSAYVWIWPTLPATTPDLWGPPDMFAWAGTNPNPDQTRLNPTYWAHFDKVVDYMFQKGMVAYIFFHWFVSSTLTGDPSQVSWPAKGSAADSLYFTSLVARYQAYPNIIWSFGKEVYYEPDQAYIHNMVNLIQSKDAYQRLRTLHDDVGRGNTNDYSADPKLNTNLDFRTIQQHNQAPNIYTVGLSFRNAKNWPIYNAEYGYEVGNDGGHTYSVYQPKEEVLNRTYKVLMTGAYPTYYYTYHGWDVVRTAEEPNGLKFYQYLTGFFTKTDWYNLAPNDNLITADTSNHCLAKPGSEYIVYLSKGGSTALNIAGASGQLSATWMNCLTGVQQAAGPFGNGSAKLTSPWPGTSTIIWIHSPTASIAEGANPPASNDLLRISNNSVELQLNHEANIRLDLVDLNGAHRLNVYSGRLPAENRSFDLKRLAVPAGMYLVVLREDNMVAQTKAYIVH